MTASVAFYRMRQYILRFPWYPPAAHSVPGFLPFFESSGLRYPRRGAAAGGHSVQLSATGPGGQCNPPHTAGLNWSGGSQEKLDFTRFNACKILMESWLIKKKKWTYHFSWMMQVAFVIQFGSVRLFFFHLKELLFKQLKMSLYPLLSVYAPHHQTCKDLAN